MIFQTVQEISALLGKLSANLDQGQALATDKKFEMDVLLQSRLAPDMYPLIKQVQIITDNAKFIPARLSGQTAPVFEDTETNLEELKARIQKTQDYLNTFKSEDFVGAEERHVTLSFVPDMYLTGNDYFVQFAMPNFYFHLTCAYAILRHNGVDIGKKDFVANLNFKPIKA